MHQDHADRGKRKHDELARRISNLQAGQASIIQHIGHLAASDAQQQVLADCFNQRLERIQRRLELS
ncbi:hypothetical protein [Thiomonas intermedia]|uniref:hypothetical protein n=1 Tax=Thiomonas intermedia TaxID=926 RepID=UPI0009A474C0|nr:hypothetical protein [Thiomonas intermedia]